MSNNDDDLPGIATVALLAALDRAGRKHAVQAEMTPREREDVEAAAAAGREALEKGRGRR